MTHEKPADSTREADTHATAQAGTTAPLPAEPAQASPTQEAQPAADPLLLDPLDPADEAALYHLLSVC